MTHSLIAALIIFVFSWLFAYRVTRKRNSSCRQIKPLTILIVGTLLSSTVMFFAIYYDKSIGYHTGFANSGVWGFLKAVLASLIRGVNLFSVSELDFISQTLANVPESAEKLCFSIFLSVLYAFAPVLTFSFILSFFKNAHSSIRLFVNNRKELYVFSELNEKNLALARSVRNDKTIKPVFTGTAASAKGQELLFSANELGAIIFGKSILDVNFLSRLKKRRICFFIFGNNDGDNTRLAIELIKKYNAYSNVNLYISTSSKGGELALETIDKGKMHIHRIDEARSLVYRALYDAHTRKGDSTPCGKDLFTSAVEMPEGYRKISAVIIGMGSYGKEMLKALSWFCQMDNYRLSIDAFDKDKNAKSKFTALCPELMSDEHNGKFESGEAQYLINIHSGIDADSYEFAEEIKKLSNTTYVFVCLGTDEENIDAAVKLRTLFLQIGITPKIDAVVFDTEKKNLLNNAKNFRGQPYNINFVGDLERSYSKEVIVASKLEEEALRVHLSYCENLPEKEKAKNEFWNYEYNYRSSMASALHKHARILCGIEGADKSASELTDEERETQRCLEHRRWNAYMRTEGYIYNSTTHNDMAKLHNDLLRFDLLTEKEKSKDEINL